MSRIFSILTFSLFAFVNAAVAQGTDETATSHVSAGRVKEDQGYIEAALAAYKKGIPLPGALNGVASVELTIGKYDSVLTYLGRSRSIDPSLPNLITNYQVEAKYWQTRNQYDSSLSFLQRALDISKELNDTRNEAIILSSIGSIYFSHEPDMNVAREYFNRSVARCDSSVHFNILARNYGRLANSYMVTGDGKSAKAYLDRAKKITDLSDNLPVRAYILSSLATLVNGEKRYDESVGFMQESMEIKRELGQLRQLQNDLLNIGVAYMTLKMYDKAQESLREGEMISKSLKDVVYLKYFYERAALLDSLTGNYKGAYANLKLAMAYKDSTFSSQRLRDVRDIQEKYEAEQKEKTIAEKELEIEQHKYQRALLIGTGIIATLTFILILINVRAQGRKEKNLLRIQTIVNTQEQVQQRIARDLHDGLVQVLGAAKVSLQAVGPESDKSILQKHIRNASEIIDEAVTEARSISHQILPYSLLRDGLVSALEDLFTRSLSSHEFNHQQYNRTLSEQVAVSIFRIAQELVNNVQKHAPSAHVVVHLEDAMNEIRLSFSDNGPGFEIGRPSTGAGVTNMITRAELIGGTLITQSAVGKGTRTELTVPL